MRLYRSFWAAATWRGRGCDKRKRAICRVTSTILLSLLLLNPDKPRDPPVIPTAQYDLQMLQSAALFWLKDPDHLGFRVKGLGNLTTLPGFSELKFRVRRGAQKAQHRC